MSAARHKRRCICSASIQEHSQLVVQELLLFVFQQVSPSEACSRALSTHRSYLYQSQAARALDRLAAYRGKSPVLCRIMTPSCKGRSIMRIMSWPTRSGREDSLWTKLWIDSRQVFAAAVLTSLQVSARCVRSVPHPDADRLWSFKGVQERG